MGAFVDRSGLIYGRLKVIERDLPNPPGRKRHVWWKCECTCGKHVVVSGHELASGDTESCGCKKDDAIRRVKFRHGHSRSKTYYSWQAAKSRCDNENHFKYADYGGRGIKMCEEWANDFAIFLRDMGERPLGKTLDRIDNSRGYEPGNCRWATPLVQSLNKRADKSVLWNGGRFTIKEIARQVGVPRTSLNKVYLRLGNDIDAAVRHVRERMK